MKQKVRARRTALLGGLPATLVFYAMFRWFLHGMRVETQEVTPARSAFFGSIEHWPVYMRSWAPLDVLFTYIFLCLAFYMTFRGLRPPGEEEKAQARAKYWLRNSFGMFLMFGSFGGIMGAVLFGWYHGLEFFLIMGGIALVFTLAFLGVVAILFVVVPPVLRALKPLVAWLSTKAIAKPFVRLGKYLDAEDVPDKTN